MDYDYMAEQLRLQLAERLTKHKRWTARRRQIVDALASGELEGVTLTAAQKNKLVLEAAAIGSAWENTCKEQGLATEAPNAANINRGLR